MLPKIRDRHNRYKLIEHFKWEMQTMLSRVHSYMGQAMNFNFWNPTGHYILNMAVPEQREVANVLLLLNKQFFNRVKANELKDRSHKGNASCLRNEKVSGGAIVWTPDYVLPYIGNFECDFIYMNPGAMKKENVTGDQEIVSLLGWFQEKYIQFKEEVGGETDKISFDTRAFAETFQSISDHLVLTTKQLLLFMDLVDGKSPPPVTNSLSFK